MAREDFREALFEVIECLTSHPLLESGKKLVIHYFNEVKEESSLERALIAINKYYPESMPEEGHRPKRLIKALENLQKSAAEWDNEEE